MATSSKFSPPETPANIALIYLQNSKTFSDTKKFSAVEYGYTDPFPSFRERMGNNNNRGSGSAMIVDESRRISYDDLIRCICQRYGIGTSENCRYVKVYGSEPPSLKPVVDKIKKVAKVKVGERSKVSGQEKQTDTGMVANAVKRIIQRWYLIERQEDPRRANKYQKFLVLIGFDEGLKRLREIALEYGWSVKIWNYKDNFFPTPEERQAYLRSVRVHDEDDVHLQYYFDWVTHTQWKFTWDLRKLKFRTIRSLTIIFNRPATWTGEMCEELVETASGIFGLPTQGRFLPAANGEESLTDFLLVIHAPDYVFESVEDNKVSREFSNNFNGLKKALSDFLKPFNLQVSTIITYDKYLEEEEGKKSTVSAAAPRFNQLSTQTPPSSPKSNSKPNADLDKVQEEPHPAQQAGSSQGAGGEIRAHSNGVGREEGGRLRTYKGRTGKPKKQILSTKCSFKSWCIKGGGCQYRHSDDEMRCFEEMLGIPRNKRGSYNTEKCRFNPCRPLRPRCTFWHPGELKRCVSCKDDGHLTNECTRRPRLHEEAASSQ